MAILKIRLEDNQVVEVPFIRGEAGKGIKSMHVDYIVDGDDGGFGTGTLAKCLIVQYTDDTETAIPLPDIFSQSFHVYEIPDGLEINFTDADGFLNIYTITNGKDGADGKDYVLTEEDKTEITNAVLNTLQTAEGGLY